MRPSLNIVSHKLEEDVENTNFTNFRFEQQARFLPGRVFFIGIVLGVFNLAWWFAPQNAQYWIFLVGLAILS